MCKMVHMIEETKKGNVLEAERVAELVFDHFRRNPERSLGVIAFGSVQEYAIDAAVQKMRLRNQEFDDFLMRNLKSPSSSRALRMCKVTRGILSFSALVMRRTLTA